MNTGTKRIAEEIQKALEDSHQFKFIYRYRNDQIVSWLRSLLEENERITKERDNLLEAVETICYHFPTPLGDDDYETAYDEVKSTAKKVYETINES